MLIKAQSLLPRLSLSFIAFVSSKLIKSSERQWHISVQEWTYNQRSRRKIRQAVLIVGIIHLLLVIFACSLDTSHCMYLGWYLRKRRDLLVRSFVAIPLDEPMNCAQGLIDHNSNLSAQCPHLDGGLWHNTGDHVWVLFCMLVYKR